MRWPTGDCWMWRRTAERVRRLRRLTPGAWTALLAATALLPAVHALQQRRPFAHWRASVEQPRGARSRNPRPPSVAQLQWAVEQAREHLPGEYKCLPAAYTMHLLMQHYGYASRVRVGVAHDEQGHVEAHAWVEFEGRIVIGKLEDMARFQPLPPLSGVQA